MALRADRPVTVTSVGWIYTYTGRQVRGVEEVCRRRATADCRVSRVRATRCSGSTGCRAAVSRLSAEVAGSSICILVVSVHVSRGDTVIRAASRSRSSAYRDFVFFR